MTLTGAQLGRIHEALLAAYSRDELLRLVRVRMDGVDFTHYVSSEKPFADQVFEFIEWANRQERALELLRCAAEGNPRNTAVQTLWAEAQGWETPAPPAGQQADAPAQPAPEKKQPASARQPGAASPESASDNGKTSAPDAQGAAPAPKPAAQPKWLQAAGVKPSEQVSPTKPLIVLKPPVEIEWVTIPAGEFLMGSDKKKDKKAKDHETPQHRLYLPEFQIAKYPITNAQYQAFVAAAGHQAPEHWKDGVMPKGLENHPVVHVSWYDVQEFCKWAKARLPSEAEWEKAARGVDGRIYPWGNDSPAKDRCNFNGNVNDTTPVDRHPKGASPYGVMEMAGNVWEWTNSLWGADFQKPQFGYPYNPHDGRETTDAPNTIIRIARGGSWNRIDPDVRCAYRVYYHPWLRYNVIGFRVVSAGFTMPWQSKGGVQSWH